VGISIDKCPCFLAHKIQKEHVKNLQKAHTVSVLKDRSMRFADVWLSFLSIDGIREYLMFYREPGFLAIVWFGSFPIPSPLSHQQVVYLFSVFTGHWNKRYVFSRLKRNSIYRVWRQLVAKESELWKVEEIRRISVSDSWHSCGQDQLTTWAADQLGNLEKTKFKRETKIKINTSMCTFENFDVIERAHNDLSGGFKKTV
jgi:hypothetical protein